jgi:hypothetical protein
MAFDRAPKSACTASWSQSRARISETRRFGCSPAFPTCSRAKKKLQTTQTQRHQLARRTRGRAPSQLKRKNLVGSLNQNELSALGTWIGASSASSWRRGIICCAHRLDRPQQARKRSTKKSTGQTVPFPGRKTTFCRWSLRKSGCR